MQTKTKCWFGFSTVVIFFGLFVGACGGGSAGSDASAPTASLVTQTSIPVNVFVLTRIDGSGNDYFSREYAEGVLASATEIAGVKFELENFVRVPDDDFDNQFQAAPYRRYGTYAVAGRVTVTVSQPYTDGGGVGLSGQAGREQTLFPYFVLRSANPKRQSLGQNFYLVGGRQDIEETARSFLHEIGHGMGLDHADVPNKNLSTLTDGRFADPAIFNTDSYWVYPDFLAHYAEKLRDARERPKDK